MPTLRRLRLLCPVFVCLVTSSLSAQHHVNARNSYERIVCVVPMAGAGTLGDPMRALYAPTPKELNITSRAGILAYSQQISEDGKLALVEFVATERKAFSAILADSRAKCFVPGLNQREDVAAEFKKYKNAFDFEKFGTRLP